MKQCRHEFRFNFIPTVNYVVKTDLWPFKLILFSVTSKVLLAHKKVLDLLFGQTHGPDSLPNPYFRYQEQRRHVECQLQVGFEELSSSFRQRLTSFTNKWSPRRFKVRLISFWDSAQNTGILNIEKGASPWKPSGVPPTYPSSTGGMWK